MEALARLVTVDDAALRRLLDDIPVGIGIAEPVEPDGSIKPEARIVYYNKHWVKMFGFDVGDVRNVKEATWRLYPDPELLEERLRSRQEAADRRRAGVARRRCGLCPLAQAQGVLNFSESGTVLRERCPWLCQQLSLSFRRDAPNTFVQSSVQ